MHKTVLYRTKKYNCISNSLPLRLRVEVLADPELINGIVITFTSGNCRVKLLDKLLMKLGLPLCSPIVTLKIPAGVTAFIFNK